MTILSRDEKRQNFIFKNLGANVPQCRKLAADASSRTYWRICLPEDKTLILLDDESGRNKCDMFVKLSNLLCESGVRIYPPLKHTKRKRIIFSWNRGFGKNQQN